MPEDHRDGPYGPDPYFESIPGHPHVAQVRREADETTSIFADTWHSDWSFLPSPPAATLLFGNVIPPVGGDTLSANQYDAWEALAPSMKALLQGKQGVHSARRGYARSGRYGEADKGRSMAIRYDDSALATQLHPVARVHPETQRVALYVSLGYTIGIDGLPDDEAQDVLRELYAHQGRDQFVYHHRWQADMLVMWDNRCLVHAASGGYPVHRRCCIASRWANVWVRRREPGQRSGVAQASAAGMAITGASRAALNRRCRTRGGRMTPPFRFNCVGDRPIPPNAAGELPVTMS